MKFSMYIPAGVFLAVASGLGASLQNNPRTLPSTLIDRPVPEFSRPSVIAGGSELTNEEFPGRISLINIFSSWCGGCRYEHPFLMELASSQTVPIYGINWKDKPGAGAEWLSRFGNPYVRTGEDAGGRLGIDLGVTGVPETFLVDDTGRIRYRHAGPLSPEVWKDVFEPILAELKGTEG